MAEGDLAYRLAEEQKRLAKLWDAYETQEQELKQALKKIAVLEAKLKEKDRINTSLRELAEVRDREIREAEVSLHSLTRELDEYRPQLDDLQKTLKDEREKYNRLFAITQELEEELNLAHLQLDGRDRWFQENLAALRALDRVLKEREELIHQASVQLRKPAKLTERKRFTVVKQSEERVVPPKRKLAKTTSTVVKKPAAKPKSPPAKAGGAMASVRPSAKKMTKDDIITLFMTLPDVDKNTAEALYNDGFSTLDELKDASINELGLIPGLNPTKARNLQTYLTNLP